MIPRRRDRDLAARHRTAFERVELSKRPVKIEIGTKSLQNLGKDQVADQQFLGSEQTVQQVGLARSPGR